MLAEAEPDRLGEVGKLIFSTPWTKGAVNPCSAGRPTASINANSYTVVKLGKRHKSIKSVLANLIL